MDKTVTLRLNTEAAGLKAGTAVARGEIKSLGEAAEQAHTKSGRAAQLHAEHVTKLTNVYRTAAGVFAALGIAKLASEYFEASKQASAWQQALAAGTGSAKAAAAEMEFLRSTAERLGVDMAAIAKPFISLTAAASGTALAGAQLREIFLGITEYGTALRVGNERIALSLNAVQQMISKGVVSSEELRQQLGESLPGAFRLAAESMGLSTREFNRMLAAGEIAAEDLLPRLASRLRDLAAASLEAAAATPEAELSRAGNAVRELFVAIGEAGLNDAVAQLFRDITSAVRDFVESGGAAALGQALATIVSSLDDLAQIAAILLGARGLVGIATVLGTLKTGFDLAGGAGAYFLATGKTLVGFLGGPWVVGLGLAAGAVLALWSAFEDGPSARESIDAAAGSIQRMQQATADLAAGAISLDQYKQKANELRPALKDVIEAIDKTKQRIADANGATWRTAEYFNGLRADKQALAELEARYIELQGQVRDAANATDAATAAMLRQQAAAKAADSALGDLTSMAGAYRDEQKRLQEQLDKLRLGDDEAGRVKAIREAQEAYKAALSENLSITERFAKVKAVAFALDEVLANAKATGTLRDQLKGLSDAQKDAARAAKDHAKALLDEWAAAQKLHDQQQIAAEFEGVKRNEENEKAALRRADALAQVSERMEDYLQGLRDETRLLQAGRGDREAVARTIEAENVRRQVANDLMAGGHDAIVALAIGQQRYNDTLDELEKRDAAGEFARIRAEVERLGDTLYDAIGELFSSGGDFSDFFEGLGRSSSQFWSQMISDSLKAGESVEQFLARLKQGASLKNPDGTWSVGGIANGIGSAYNLYQSYRSGSPLNGAAAGASLGATVGSIVPVIGTAIGAVVGAIVGAIAGLLGGPKTPDLRLGATGIVRKPENNFTTDLGSMQIGVRGGTNASEFIKLVTEFDDGMADLIGTFRNGAEQLDAVKAALSRWSVDIKGEISSEEVLSSRFAAILATFNSDIQAFVGTSGKLEDRVKRLGEAAFIDAAAASGELLDSFGPLADLLLDYRDGTEDLGQTYGRLLEATQGLEAATAIMGANLGLTREEFVRFAADIAEAAGGVQQASALWSTYFQVFYDANETREIAQSRALDARNSALSAIGLEATISADRFRQLFEAALPSLSPEDVVKWLRAGAAIGAYNTAVQASADAAEEAARPLRELRTTLDSFASGLDQQMTELARSGLSDFQRQMLEIDDGLQSNVSQLQAWRQQLIANGGSAADLARVDTLLGRAHELAAAQAARAIAMLRNAGRSLVQQLMGGDGNSSTVNNAAQGMADAGVSAFQTIGEAAQQLADQQLSALKRIKEYLDGQLLGDLSSLTPGQKYAEAQSQFAAALAAAQGGDVEALGNISQIADTLLRLGRERFAGGGEFLTLEASVRAALQGLLGLQPGGIGAQPGAPLGVGNGMGGFGLQAATTEFGQQATENRLELAQQISEIVRDLLQATGESLSAVAESLGLNLNDLVSALGINLTDLSVQTATSLAGLAGNLGVELTDLASQVGVDLGSLADAQSLMNDAVEAAIDKLPADQRDRLKPLLEGVEQAAATGGPELVNEAIRKLEAETRRIGGAAASALAPFLDGIDPTDPLDRIDGVLRQQFGTVQDIYTLLQQWLVTGAPPDPILPNSPPEPITVTPGKSLRVISPGSVPSALLAPRESGPSKSELDMLAEMKAMRAQMERMERVIAAGTAGTTKAVTDNTAARVTVTEKQTRDLKGGARGLSGVN